MNASKIRLQSELPCALLEFHQPHEAIAAILVSMADILSALLATIGLETGPKIDPRKYTKIGGKQSAPKQMGLPIRQLAAARVRRPRF
jgi:hypothetical protein